MFIGLYILLAFLVLLAVVFGIKVAVVAGVAIVIGFWMLGNLIGALIDHFGR